MKNKIQLLALTILLSGSLFAQTTWTVDNTPGAPADFSSLQGAIDSVSPGDILLVHGSPITYGNIVINKEVGIIGTGYFLSQNPNTQANVWSSAISNISFLSGSSGSNVKGLDSYSNEGGVYIAESDIILKRNRLKYIRIAEDVHNIMILNNYIYDRYSCGTYCHYSIGNCSNCSNIIIKGNRLSTIQMSCPIVLTNNYFTRSGYGYSAISNSILKNNIIGREYSGNGSGVWNNNIMEYNVVLSANPGTITTDTNGNVTGATFTDVFISNADPRYSDDGKYLLKIGSPAFEAGENGVDCGIFGGGYRLSGIPEIPNIYEFIIPETGYTNEGIQVEIKVKSDY